MAKKNFFTMTILFLTMVINAWANPALLPEAVGWRRVTSITQNDIGDRYFVFVADGQDLMLGADHTTSAQNKNGTNYVLFYQAIIEPFRDQAKVFTLEALGDAFAMRNLQNSTYLFQSSSKANYWRTNDISSTSASNASTWCPVKFVYDEGDGAWTIVTLYNSRQLGIYGDVAGTPEIGTEVGANSEANAQKFQIYAISKTAFDALRATISTAAILLPENGAMEAGKWYYYDVEGNGTYTVTSSISLSQIAYTADGSVLVADAGSAGAPLEASMELEAGRIYLKAETDATVSFMAGAIVNPLDPADGWTQITSISQADITDNYYVFVADGQSLMLGADHTTSGQNKSGRNHVLFYQAMTEPYRDQAKVFTLEALGDFFAMRNLQNSTYLFQGSSNANYWRTNDITSTSASNAKQWCRVNFVYADGAWTILTILNSRPLGIFENKPGTPGIGMEVGANSEANAQKFQIYAISKANFEKLTATIASSAVAWPEGGALEAGKWYAYTVAANGSYTIDTDDLNKVLYTLDGSILVRDDEQVTTTLQSTMELAAGTIYLKALEATTVTFSTEGFAAAPSIVDGKYIQTLDGVTVGFATPANTNPFAVQGDAKATLSNNTTGESTELEMNVSGLNVSFASTALTPGSDYTLTIPAGAVGYSELNANPEAVAIQFYTPALFDGEYYFYNEENKAFMSRGANWGTRAVLDNYGYPVAVSTTDANVTRILFLDNNLYLGSDGYTDKAVDYSSIDWSVEKNDDGLIFKSSNGSYLVKSENEYFRVNGTSATATPFVLKTLEEQKAIVAALQDANIKKAAEAAGLTYTDKASFEQYLADNYSFIDQTSRIISPTVGSQDSWPYTEYSGTTYNTGEYGGEIYASAGAVKQTVNVPVAGLYKLTVSAFFRDGTNENCYAQGQKGYVLSNAYVTVNNTYFAPLRDWYSISTSPTAPNNVDQAKAIMDAGNSDIEIYAYVGDNLTMDIELRVPGKINYGWAIFGNWRLTFIGDEDAIFMAQKEEMAERWESFKEISVQATEHEDFDQVLDNAINLLPSIATEEELAAKDTEVWRALCEFITTHTTPSGQFDITSVITNPNFDKGTVGWESQNGLGYSNGVAEDFGHTSSNISQTLKDMPAGTYTMKVQSFFRTKAYRYANYEYEQGTEIIPAQMFFGTASQAIKSINDDARMQPARPSSDVNGAFRRSIPNSLNGTNDAFVTGQYWNVMSTTLDNAGDITFGLRHDEGKDACWMPFDNFRLYYGAENVNITLSESEPFAVTDDTRANVTLSRTLNAGEYNPVCLPFDVDASVFQSAWTLAGIEDEDGVLTGTLIPVKQLKAGECYWVTVAADIPELHFDDVLVRAYQPDSIPVLWEGGALKGTFNGYKAQVILNEDLSGDISFKEVDFNAVKATVNLENWQVRRFLSEVTYDAASSTQIAKYNVPAPARRDEPHQVFIPVPETSGTLTLTYSTSEDFDNSTTVTATAKDGLIEMLNLEPQQTYYYKVEDGATVVSQGQVNTEGNLRQIMLPTVSNVRDMGGWLTAGGNRVNYGFVYRGGELNGDHLMFDGTSLSEADRLELRRLGVLAEIDLREDNDDSVKDVDEAGKKTALGDDAQYIYLNLNMWNAQALQLNSAKFRDVFNFMISNLRDGRNVYFHCMWGADRTGAVGFLLNGLLGATPDQLYKDYELTSLSLAGSREKETLDASDEKLQYIQSLDGSSLQMKFYTYFKDVAGVDPADLDWLIRYLNGDTYDLLTDIEIDESKAYDNTQAYKTANVTLNRTIKVGMNTVVLPFALTAEDIAYLGGADAEAYTVSEYDPAIDDFKFAQLDEVPANTPFFLKATVASADREDGNVFTFEGKTIVAGEPVATVGEVFSLVGTYDETTAVPVSTTDDNYYILNGGKFYNVDSEGVKIKNTRFYILVATPKVEINENESYDNTLAYKSANITLTRTIKEGMNSVVLPFALTADDIAYLGGEEAVAYTVSDYNVATDNIVFAIATEVPANTPFFLNATEATTGAGEFTFEGKAIVAGDPVVEVGGTGDCSLVGTYERITVPECDANGSYYILSGGKFYSVDSAVTIKNTRFYVATSAPAGSNTLGFIFEGDGEVDAINGIVDAESAPKAIYNLQGQKVNNPVKGGIYIINGHKVLIK